MPQTKTSICFLSSVSENHYTAAGRFSPSFVDQERITSLKERKRKSWLTLLFYYRRQDSKSRRRVTLPSLSDQS